MPFLRRAVDVQPGSEEAKRFLAEAISKQLKIFVNGKEAFSHTFSVNPTAIVGVSYRFQGAGAVNAVKLSRLDGSAVLEDRFGD